MDKLNRIKELVKLLNEYRDSYYNDSKSKISDFEYDKLFNELQQLEKETGICLSNSPTQTVGYEVKSELQKVKHSHPMLSLDKTKSVDDLVKFTKDEPSVLSLKMDGLTVLLTYENGELVQAETRGNGEIGELITHNAKVFENIPLKIDHKGHIEFEGEAVITYSDFEKINASIPNPDDRYKNPRNLASGSVRQLDSSIAAERHIKFVLWKVPMEKNSMIRSFQDAEKLGFEVVPYSGILAGTDKETIEKIIDLLKDKAKKLGYPIDGLVISYNDIQYGKSLGMTSRAPRHSLAYKFYDEEVETTLLEVEWTMGKTGSLCPTAVFEPVELEGTTVNRASVHNVSILKSLEIGIGDCITVYKANQIIPQVSDNLTRSGNITIPDVCPVCGGKTEIIKDNDTEVLYCSNFNCKGKLLGKLCAFVSRDRMDITGLSEATLEILINKGYVNSFKDIYHLSDYKAELSSLPGFGAKSVEKLLKAIESSRKTTLDKFLASLSIPLIGRSASKELSKYCHGDVNEFSFIVSNTILEFMTIDGIGEKMLESLDDWWNDNVEMFYELLDEITIEIPEETPNFNDVSKVNLNGATFSITGKLQHYSNREALVAQITAFNGRYVSSISKKTNYLINNDKTSTSGKNKKALENNVTIISEKDFMQMCGM